jgi:hypothetical protein
MPERLRPLFAPNDTGFDANPGFALQAEPVQSDEIIFEGQANTKGESR